jgi:hypothetical protein
MAEEAIKIGGKKKSTFIDKVKDLLPEGGNLNLCGVPGDGPGGDGPAQVSAYGGVGDGRGGDVHALGVDVHHVPALHLRLPDEDQYPPTGV